MTTARPRSRSVRTIVSTWRARVSGRAKSRWTETTSMSTPAQRTVATTNPFDGVGGVGAKRTEPGAVGRDLVSSAVP